MQRRAFGRVAALLLLGALVGCTTFYRKYARFNERFEAGQIEQARHLLDKEEKWAEGRNRLLYFLNQGVVLSMLGEHAASNDFLEQAHRYGEDYRKNVARQAASFLLNPNVTAYVGEDHELLLVHYYKALNFLKLNDRSAALVECRRLNIKLNELSDRYTGERKYRRDAFINLLMGLIYEASEDHNNAFVAYRNAVDVYQNDYQRLFGVGVPNQLKQDVVRTAYLAGLPDEARRFEEMFGVRYARPAAGEGAVVFLWHNGLGPVKTEWSLNFLVNQRRNGDVFFVNEALGLNFPFHIDPDEDGRTGLEGLRAFRVAFPKYVERPLRFRQATLSAAGQSHPLELATDVNAIAFQTLNQRMLREMGASLLRLALKKAAEYSVREKNEDAAVLVGFLNALTEQADTRNWQTLPHSIYYQRLTLPAGPHILTLRPGGQRPGTPQTFKVDVRAGQTYFQTFHSLDAGRFQAGAQLN